MYEGKENYNKIEANATEYSSNECVGWMRMHGTECMVDLFIHTYIHTYALCHRMLDDNQHKINVGIKESLKYTGEFKAECNGKRK